jgi:hypothetical protein
VLDEGKTPQDVLQDAARMLEKRFELTHTTIQVEVKTCEQAFACDPHGGEHAHDGEHHHHH